MRAEGDGITSKAALQESLFPEQDSDPLHPLATNVPATTQTGRRGPGRPPGALNVATREMREYLRANFADPVVGRAHVSQMRPQDLATALGCTLLEAFDRIQQAKEFVARYVHQELPKAVEFTGGGQVVLNIGAVGSGEAMQLAEGSTVTISGTLSPPQQDQSLSATQPAELDGGKLDG